MIGWAKAQPINLCDGTGEGTRDEYIGEDLEAKHVASLCLHVWLVSFISGLWLVIRLHLVSSSLYSLFLTGSFHISANHKPVFRQQYSVQFVSDWSLRINPVCSLVSPALDCAWDTPAQRGALVLSFLCPPLFLILAHASVFYSSSSSSRGGVSSQSLFF